MRRRETNCAGYRPRKPKATRAKNELAPRGFTGFQYEEFGPSAKYMKNVLLPVVSTVPSVSFFKNQEESEYFKIFSTKTAMEILPLFASESFRRLMLQASESDLSIRHAVIALGALDKTSQLVSKSENEKESLRKHHERALQQYAIALKHMREHADKKPDLRIALLHCLVTLCFEAWSGNQIQAMGQIQLGFRLIQAWKEESGNDTPLAAMSTHDSDLFRIFGRLDVQAMSLAKDSFWLKEHPFVDGDMNSFWAQMPSTFTSLEEAEPYTDGLSRRTMHILSRGTGRPKNKHVFPVNGWWGDKTPSVMATQRELLKDGRRWFSAFKPLYQKVCEKETPERVIYAKTLVVFARTGHHGTYILCCDDEMEYDQFTDSYRETVDYCEDILRAMEPSEKWPPDPKFSFDSIVVIPLYIISHKCRDPVVRRKCISLLLGYSRREGVWDSIFAGKMGQWAMEVEEDFIGEDGVIPGWARIHGMGFEKDIADRQAVLTCQQRISPFSDEEITRRKVITW
ncbi:hypothetical protein HYFRA_00002132 [Hymenoscyphus fraxineus]|uniref:C6 zinc finger domain-containing protein n=1 Tax=Hymenoscyphus fraxineus TaxID=746836 RepID=A0A9N9KJX8_9HELO|nr:hypothetical protein HYFRA_00002132 [Hymenoscyphus fraxineus]